MQQAQFQLHAQIEDRHWWFLARRKILRGLVETLVPPVDRPLVVDVGCGTGANLAAFADSYQTLGADTSPDAIELAQQRFPGIDYRCGFAPGAFGDAAAQAKVFLLTDVLEHVPDDFLLLSQLLAAASPGAYFVVTVPAEPELWSPHDETFGHYRRYQRDRLLRVWQGLPVTPLLVTHFNARLYPAVKSIRRLQRVLPKRSREWTDFGVPSGWCNRLLTSIFQGELPVLLRQLRRSETGQGYRRGVSLLAVLRREPGPVPVRNKPCDLPADLFEPETMSPSVAACSIG